MLKTKVYGDVTVIKTGRHFSRQVFYYVNCFLIKNTLVDTSTVYVAQELLGNKILLIAY